MAGDASGVERILRDAVLDERLARDGLVLVPMVEPDDLAAVESAFWNLVPSGEQGIQLDYLRTDRAFVRKTADLLTSLWERVVPGVLEHHYPVYSSFVVKYPGADSSLYLHRDLYVDDERFRRTFSMWMPFVDTAPELDNGTLAFVPQSQQVRYGGFGPNAAVLSSPYEHHLEPRLEPVAVPAGSAVVYDARMLHASAPNHTTKPRLAVGCLLARRDQPVIQVFATGRRHRRVHQVDPDYFIEHAPADIALHGMPDRYPVLDEYDETPLLDAADVLGPTLCPPEGVTRTVIVPPDLESVAGDRQPLPVHRGRSPRHDHDLAIAAGDLPAVGAVVGGGVAVDASGPVGALDLTRRWRRTGSVPAAVPDVVARLGAPFTRDATLLVLDPRARVRLDATAGGRRHEVVVIESTPVRSGACATDRVAEADLGARIDLPPDRPIHLWNEGPGPLVVLVRNGRLSRRGGPRPGVPRAR